MADSSSDSNSDSTRELCKQCAYLFSPQGISHLQSGTNPPSLNHTKLKHSLLESFPDRIHSCRFCRFLWNENLVGTGGGSRPTRPYRCLRDLLHPQAPVQSNHVGKFVGSWVVVTEAGRITSEVQRERYLESNASQGRNFEAFAIMVESAKGRILADFPLLRVVAEADDPCADITALRPLTWSGLTPESAPLLRALVQACETSHAHCKLASPRPFPSRLLQILEDGSFFRLHVTPPEGQIGQYCALTYCWGGPQLFALEKRNLDKLQHEKTDTTALPQTLQDAILVTHRLEKEYLWVDALCIIQDSPEDKAREISRMCDVYENAVVTISAATAASVKDGFLKPTGAISGRFASCAVTVLLGDEGNTKHGRIVVTPEHAQKTEEFPINKRGWTYQEALLCPRQLVFGDLEPYLRCQSKEVMAMRQTCIRYDYKYIQPRRLLPSIALSSDQVTVVEDGEIIDLRLELLWAQLVDEYTHRALTLIKDKPLAIASVVDSVTRTTGDACHYGVWRSCPVACLIWEADNYERDPQQVRKSESCRIPGVPTWSWMSITAPVLTERAFQLRNPEATAWWDEQNPGKRLHILCRVLEESDVLMLGRAGTVGNGAAKLIDWYLDLGTVESRPYTVARERPHVDDNVPLYFLIVGRLVNGTITAILASRDENDVYSRCGLAELRDSHAIAAKKPQEIILE